MGVGSICQGPGRYAGGDRLSPPEAGEDLAAGLMEFLAGANRVAVLGLGNPYRSDDLAGLAAARVLREMLPEAASGHNPSVAVLESHRGLLPILSDLMELAPERLLILDAADLGAAPGTVALFGPGSILESGLSTHENNLALGLQYLAAVLPGCPTALIGIQFSSMDHSENAPLSPAVERGVKEMVTVLARALGGS